MGGWTRLAVVLGALSGWTPSAVSADGMRCGRNLVRDGQRTADVRALCGAPSSARQRVATTTGFVIEEWTYDFGPNDFVRHLTFENDVLVRIVTGDYGRRR